MTSAQIGRYDFSLEDTILCRANPDIHPPFKGTASRCASTGSPICRDHVQGVHEVDDGAEGEFGEVDGRNVLGCLGVLAVEFRHKSPCTFYIFRWSPFVFLYAVSLPMYEVLEFSSEDSAVEYEFHLIFPDTIADNRGRGVTLNSLSYHICIVGL